MARMASRHNAGLHTWLSHRPAYAVAVNAAVAAVAAESRAGTPAARIFCAGRIAEAASSAAANRGRPDHASNTVASGAIGGDSGAAG